MRIIPSICSTATRDLVFFATGEKDYSKVPPMRSGKKIRKYELGKRKESDVSGQKAKPER